MLEATFQEAYPLALRAAGVRFAGAVAAGRLTADEREDWVQEAALAAWRALPRYSRSRASMRTFVERIVANRFSSLMRVRRRQLSVEALEKHHHELSTLDGIPGLVFRIDVQAVIDSLPERDRRLALAVAEHNVTEAARKLRQSRSTVYLRLRTLRSQFKVAGLGMCNPW